jgi:hypothetical protein
VTELRDWLIGQKTTDDPSTTGITAADLIARFAASRATEPWTTLDELYFLIDRDLNLGTEPWFNEAMAEVHEQYTSAPALRRD